jgi:hypothetical protein
MITSYAELYSHLEHMYNLALLADDVMNNTEKRDFTIKAFKDVLRTSYDMYDYISTFKDIQIPNQTIQIKFNKIMNLANIIYDFVQHLAGVFEYLYGVNTLMINTEPNSLVYQDVREIKNMGIYGEESILDRITSKYIGSMRNYLTNMLNLIIDIQRKIESMNTDELYANWDNV